MKVGSYELVSMISKGGQGDVALGRSADGREVAIKLIRGRPDAPQVLERIQREQRLQTLFKASQGFVPIMDAGESAYGPYLIMPFLRGGSLRDKLEQGPLGLERTLALAHALSRAMATAHRLGVVHRDLKPDNILFDEQDRPFVCDLGLAKHYRRDLPGGSQSTPLSKTGELRGTFGYMAPEQIRDAKSVGPPADVFSLGVIIHECLAGSPPYSVASAMAYLAEVERGKPPTLTDSNDCPAWLAGIVQRCLRPAPEQRFTTARELAVALEARSGGTRRGPLVLVASVTILISLGLALAFGQGPDLEPRGIDNARANAVAGAQAALSERRPRQVLSRLSEHSGDDVDDLRAKAFRLLALEAFDRSPRRAVEVLAGAAETLSPTALDELRVDVARRALPRDDALDVLTLLEGRRAGSLRGPEFASFYLDRARAALARGRSRQALLLAARAARANPSRAVWLPELASIYQTEFSLAVAQSNGPLWFETVLAGLRLGLTYGLFTQGSDGLFEGGLLAHLERRLKATPDDPELQVYYARALRREGLLPQRLSTEEASRRAVKLARRVLADERLTLRARPIAYETLGEHLRRLHEPDAASGAYRRALEAHHPRPDDCLLALTSMARDADRFEEAVGLARRFVAARDERVAKSLEGNEAIGRGRPPAQPLEPLPSQDDAWERQEARHVLLNLLLITRSPQSEELVAELVALRPSTIWAKGAKAKVETLASGDPGFFDPRSHPAGSRQRIRAMATELAEVAERRGEKDLAKRLLAHARGTN